MSRPTSAAPKSREEERTVFRV
jgi:hypothetical protein